MLSHCFTINIVQPYAGLTLKHFGLRSSLQSNKKKRAVVFSGGPSCQKRASHLDEWIRVL